MLEYVHNVLKSCNSKFCKKDDCTYEEITENNNKILGEIKNCYNNNCKKSDYGIVLRMIYAAQCQSKCCNGLFCFKVDQKYESCFNECKKNKKDIILRFFNLHLLKVKFELKKFENLIEKQILDCE